MYRALYLRALAPEGPLPLSARDVELVRAALSAPDTDGAADRPADRPRGSSAGEPAGAGASDAALPELMETVRRWSGEEADRFASVLEGPEAVRGVLRECAPLALSAGAWLQWIPSPGNSETEPVLRVLTLYASDVGAGLPLSDRGSAYRALLRRHRIAEEQPGVRLASSEYVETAGFRLPALLLAMSRLPDEFLPEILGADLCLRAVGTLPAVAAVVKAGIGSAGAGGTDGDDLESLDMGGARPGAVPTARELSLAAAHAYIDERSALAGPAGGREAERRLRLGFHWAAREVRSWSARLLDETALARQPDHGVWRMICRRARQAAVYHSDYELEGRPLSDWFADVAAGPGPFLTALARSRLVRPGKPDSSPLLGGLVAPDGPMFRIFTDEDVAVLRRWIAHLPSEGSVLHPKDGPPPAHHEALREAQRTWHAQDAAHQDADGDTRRDTGRTDTASGSTASAARPGRRRTPAARSRPTARGTYRSLLSRADSPALREFAHSYATRWLARSRYAPHRAPEQLPAHWDAEHGLRHWLTRAHDRHAETFQEGDVELPSREELIDSTLQLAPLIMIDGGWLQGFTDYQHASSRSGHLLFRTYWDELGNGESELNHPRIYRALLSEMGIDLPATASPEFSAWPDFRDEAFSMPVYWLSISRFPETFMPEILGLNLAMELSGVGGSYRSARVGLKHHGFSTQFVDLHNTIDNVATGHSAWAADAIDSYLADLPGVLGPGGTHDIWERIKVGHRSLNPPGGRAAELYAAFHSRRAKRARRPDHPARQAPEAHQDRPHRPAHPDRLDLRS
ncbi:iron-containing redox enzyme family protein [Streptomyces sp. NPDC058653]|uniref:iron-containing redox enzyme family protein n=1 Tax=Streptomyces sp. NPDC058653 TaxID=3346576 RepID=UPI003656711C